ncbi:MAG: hypothetical protein ACYC7E_05635 [Armatimonadota bacterium]
MPGTQRVSTSRLAGLLLLLAVALHAQAGGGRNRVMGSEALISPSRGSVTIDGNLEEWDIARAKLLTLVAGGGEDTRSNVPLAGYSARLSLQYDSDALYAAVWWNDPTPLGPQTSAGCTPPGDGLILSLPLGKRITRVACWRTPGGSKSRAMISMGAEPLAKGKELAGAAQGYNITGKTSYTQEIRIPWQALGGMLAPGQAARLGVELCFGGLDPAAGYKAWKRDVAAGLQADGNRWGGHMCWGFMDGIRSPEQLAPTYDPATGAEVKLLPAGAVTLPNPPVMYDGNEQTRTTLMIAVPAEKVTLDGKLDEWNPRTATTIASEPTLFPNRYAVDVHWAYDAKGLYAGLRWRTGGPHLNINDPAKIDRGYDGGDAVQIRLGADRVTHVDAWYYDEGKRPMIKLAYGAKFNEGSEPAALAKGAALALQPTAGGGYTQEIFLPWALITKTGVPLKEGAAFRVVLDVFFSGLEGNRIPFIVNAKVAQPSGVVNLPFTAPEDGLYTVVIEDPTNGRIIRHLATQEKMRRGQRVGDWDGLDDDGNLANPGKYTFKGLRHQGIGLNYLTTYNNPGTPPWQTDDGAGEWGGDHAPPQSVVADGSDIYLGWPSAEDGNGIIGCDLAGTKRWGYFQTPYAAAAGGTALLAVDGPHLYFANEAITRPQKGQTALAYFKTVISCLDRANGFRRGFSLNQAYQEIAAHDTTRVTVNWWWDLWTRKDFSLDTYAIHDDYFYSGHCAGGNLAGLAARDGKLYVSFRLTNEVVVYNSADLSEAARWEIAKPAGLVFATDGALYGISDTSVVRIDLRTGATAPVVTAGLEAPVGLAVGVDGSFYVSDWGAAQCVKVFDKTGKLQRTVGKPGGRAWVGVYDPNGMLLPRGVAVDKAGKLWVCEDDNMPRRISVWDAVSGKFLREFVGGTTYGAVTGGMIDPKNPSRAMSAGVWFGIELGKPGYRPLTTVDRRLDREMYYSFGPAGGANQGPGTRFIDYAGRRFVACAESGHIVIGTLRPDGGWTPLAAVGGVFNRGDNPQIKPEEKLLWREGIAPAFFRKHAAENYIWADANGDGKTQEEEFQWRKQDKDFPNWDAYWGVGMLDKEMNVYIGGNGLVARFSCKGLSGRGVPQYDINDCKILFRQEGSFRAVCVDGRGWVLTVNPAETRRWGDKNQSLSAYDAEGKLRWRIPTTEDYRRPDLVSGEGLMGPVDGGGEAGEIVGLTQWHGLHVPLVTTDGLYIGRLLRDPAEGGAPGPDMYRGETVQYLNRLADGRIILSHGKNAHHLLQVTGLENVKRFSGAFELTAAQAQLAADRARAHQAKTEAAAPIRIVQAKTPVTVDGILDEWDWTTAGAIGLKTGAPRAEVALRTVERELSVAFKVYKNGSFLNTGTDPTQLFLTGDAVDLQFSLDPAADPGRKAPVLGDCRLVISKVDGKPTAVLYRAQVPGAKNPVAFRSPAREVVFDEVTVMKTARVEISDTPDGYLVEATVPFAALGLTDYYTGLWPGRVLQGDAGIIVADKTGRRVARIYRFNKDTQIVSDVPTEAALTPSQWGEMEVDK